MIRILFANAAGPAPLGRMSAKEGTMTANEDGNLLEWAKKKKEESSRLTPIAIKNKEFTKKLKGYAQEEVNDFIIEIYESYQDLWKENALLKEVINRLEGDVKRYKDMETKMNNALLSTQTIAEELKSKYEKEHQAIKDNLSKKENELTAEKNKIIETAENEAAEIVKSAKEHRNKYLSEIESIKKNYQDDIGKLKKYREELLNDLKNFFQKKANELQHLVNEMKGENKSTGNNKGKQE